MWRQVGAKNKIRKVTPDGVVTTFAGTGTQGHADGDLSIATFNRPDGIALNTKIGILYIADTQNNVIRKITTDGMGNPVTVSTLAGSGTSGLIDGTGANAAFNNPEGITIDANGNLFVADRANNTIRKVTPGGDVTTIAGQQGMIGDTDGPGRHSHLQVPP
ncbi:MAG: SMP-30/gluconolactonase/LRE family protein [Polyangiaceae bacterium]|nr:SMP-30/gluconolactonase/LRE family protein [Polyangiaceae bacterium]